MGRWQHSGPQPRFALENSLLLAGYYGNPPSQSLLRQTATEGANMGRGSVRGGEKGDAIFRAALIPVLLLFGSFLTSRMIRRLVHSRGCVPAAC